MSPILPDSRHALALEEEDLASGLGTPDRMDGSIAASFLAANDL